MRFATDKMGRMNADGDALRAEIRRVIQRFYDRVFEDPMIGFFFKDKNKDILIEREVQLALSILELEKTPYKGRSMKEVHGKLNIFTGHFNRRIKILEEELAKSELPQETVQKWLEHSRSLLEEIVFKGPGASC